MELKTNGGDVAKEVHRILKKHNKLNQVIWGYKDSKHVAELRNIDPNVARFCSAGELMKVLVAYTFGFLPYITLTFDTLQVPLFTDGYRVTLLREMKSCLKRRLFFAFMHIVLWIAGPMFIHLKKRGIETILWVINSEEELEECLRYEGVSGIMTDRPEHFIQICQKKSV